METACRLRAWPPPPMLTIRSSSSACSWLPSRLWPGSAPCSPTKGTTLSTIAICAASSVSRRGSTCEVSRPARDWASGAGRWSAATRGCLRTSVSLCAMTGSGSSSSRSCRAHASSWLQNALLANSENRLLGRPKPDQRTIEPDRPGGRAAVGASRHQQAAGDIANLAGDEARLVRGKIKDEICHLFRAAEPAHRRPVHPAPVRGRADGLHHGRVDAPRRDGVHADVVALQL